MSWVWLRCCWGNLQPTCDVLTPRDSPFLKNLWCLLSWSNVPSPKPTTEGYSMPTDRCPDWAMPRNPTQHSLTPPSLTQKQSSVSGEKGWGGGICKIVNISCPTVWEIPPFPFYKNTLSLKHIKPCEGERLIPTVASTETTSVHSRDNFK